MSYLLYLCLFANSVVQHMCCVLFFPLFNSFFVLFSHSVTNVARFSGLSILNCPFGFL